MKVFKNLNDIPKIQNAVITTGTFDGVHLGHQKIISKLNRLAKEVNGESIIITFHPHPRFVINPDDKSLKLIHTLEEKIAILEKYGVNNLAVATFSKEFSQIAAEKYIADFLVAKFHPKIIVIGYDHQFGKDRKGDIDLLRKLSDEYQYGVEEIGKEMLEDIAISSTKVRKALDEGEVSVALNLLGHPFSISGYVVKGQQIGASIGFPTANIHVPVSYKLIPRNGVYAVLVHLHEKVYKGMLNIGYRPTFEGTNKTIEVNIFDFKEDIYGETLEIDLIDRIRFEKKFIDKEALIERLKSDKDAARTLLIAYADSGS